MLDIFKHLLPRARAWTLIPAKTLRAFFQGLANALADVRSFIDDVYDDLDPQRTRQLATWEAQFALPDAFLTEAQRRDRLAGVWAATGGQSPQYLQDTLRAAGFDVYVHEWWAPGTLHPAGGSVNGDEAPTARNPFLYLNNGTTPVYLMCDGQADALDGGVEAFDGNTNTLPGYALANRVWADHTGVGFKSYSIPADPTKYPYFLYIGGANFPDQALVPEARRTEFEALCLKYRPTQNWLGMLITYT